MHRFFSAAAIILFMVLLLCFPTLSIQGASAGILLWYKRVLPVLLPFALASHLMLETNLLGRFSHRIYVIIMGFLCGYPMGAIWAASLTRDGKIVPEEGQRLLWFCNQPSPMFLIGYLGVQCLGIAETLSILAAAYLPPLVFGYLLLKRNPVKKAETDSRFIPLTVISFEKAWIESCVILVKIGGYVLFFSMIATYLCQLPFENPVWHPLLVGICEMTTGTGLLAGSVLPILHKGPLGLFLVCFGGLSCLAQTAGCLPGSGLKTGSYILAKLACALCSCGLFYLYLYSRM